MMSSIGFGMISGTPQSHAVMDVKQQSGVRQTEVEASVYAKPPVVDEYIPEEKQEPSGRYWLGQNEDGQPKVYFDDPEQAADDKTERCTANTDQVDREIERLKSRKEALQRQIDAQTDETKIEELERKLAQIEQELAQKDNDTYRRRHSVFT